MSPVHRNPQGTVAVVHNPAPARTRAKVSAVAADRGYDLITASEAACRTPAKERQPSGRGGPRLFIAGRLLEEEPQRAAAAFERAGKAREPMSRDEIWGLSNRVLAIGLVRLNALASQNVFLPVKRQSVLTSNRSRSSSHRPDPAPLLDQSPPSLGSGSRRKARKHPSIRRLRVGCADVSLGYRCDICAPLSPA